MRLQELRPKHIVESWMRLNDGSRTLVESIVVPEVAAALKDWKKGGAHGTLIGGLALSFHGYSRATVDGDFLFLSAGDIPSSVDGFKKIRDHAFRHKPTHVEIEVLDPEFLHMPKELVKKIIDTAVTSDGIKVASKEGLLASKLNRFNRRDQADIEELIKAGAKLDDDWPLPDEYRARYESIAKGT